MGREHDFFCGRMDSRKQEFIACRLDRQLFLSLREMADKQNTDLSSLIRMGCKNLLHGQEAQVKR